MNGVPILHFEKDLTADGTYSLLTNDVGANMSFPRIPRIWTLQVSGLTAADAAATPTAWDVQILGSIDGINFVTQLVRHVNGTNTIGTVKSSATSYELVRFAKLYLTSLNLGATAKKLRCAILASL
jgi:hypothetical protein